MKASRHSLRYNPFRDLDAIRVPDVHPVPREPLPEPETDEDLFQKAMEEVVPIDRGKVFTAQPRNPGSERTVCPEDSETLQRLRDLVARGRGFSVAHTPEYMEGSPYQQALPDITERLHGGDFSVQDHLDLHGMTLEEGEKQLEVFVSDATARGLRMVLVIHGRGKSSPAEPVLKSMVRKWLTTGPCRAWVMAFASARLCDGGAGATYVLLRHRPLTKRHKKQRKGRE